jgi:hypothetical protein
MSEKKVRVCDKCGKQDNLHEATVSVTGGGTALIDLHRKCAPPWMIDMLPKPEPKPRPRLNVKCPVCGGKVGGKTSSVTVKGVRYHREHAPKKENDK